MTIKFEETNRQETGNCGEYADIKLIHICEVCGKEEVLTPEEGFEAGWDYAPYMYSFGVVSPRTCGNCTINKTAWWSICCEGKAFEELSDKQKATVRRIYQEPESILPK